VPTGRYHVATSLLSVTISLNPLPYTKNQTNDRTYPKRPLKGRLDRDCCEMNEVVTPLPFKNEVAVSIPPELKNAAFLFSFGRVLN
jgi:hypothetical protein